MSKACRTWTTPFLYGDIRIDCQFGQSHLSQLKDTLDNSIVNPSGFNVTSQGQGRYTEYITLYVRDYNEDLKQYLPGEFSAEIRHVLSKMTGLKAALIFFNYGDIFRSLWFPTAYSGKPKPVTPVLMVIDLHSPSIVNLRWIFQAVPHMRQLSLDCRYLRGWYDQSRVGYRIFLPDLQKIMVHGYCWAEVITHWILPNLSTLYLNLHLSAPEDSTTLIRLFHTHGPLLRHLEIWSWGSTEHTPIPEIFSLCIRLQSFVVGNFMPPLHLFTAHECLEVIEIKRIAMEKEKEVIELYDIFTSTCRLWFPNLREVNVGKENDGFMVTYHTRDEFYIFGKYDIQYKRWEGHWIGAGKSNSMPDALYIYCLIYPHGDYIRSTVGTKKRR